MMIEEEIVKDYPIHLKEHEALNDRVEKIDWRVGYNEGSIKEIQDWWKWALRVILGTIILAVLGLVIVNK